ncbi:MAG: HEAT repeat domain-containing protein [Thermoguttaceae bacterium]
MAFVGVCFGVEPKPAVQEKEPVYEGKTLSQWTALAKDKDAKMRIAAIASLGKIGPLAIPTLTDLCKDANWRVRQAAFLAVASMGYEAKWAAYAAARSLKEDKDRDVRKAVQSVHLPIFPNMDPCLMEVLKDDKGHVRQGVAVALNLFSEPEKTVPALTELLDDKSYSVCLAAMRRLAQIGPNAREAVPALIRMTKDDKYYLRWMAVSALGSIGPEAKEAVPVLIKLLKDKHEYVNVEEEAILALEHVGCEKEISIPILVSLLNVRPLRCKAALTLGMMSPDARIAVPAIKESLSDTETESLKEGYVDNGTAVDCAAVAEALWRLGETKTAIRTRTCFLTSVVVFRKLPPQRLERWGLTRKQPYPPLEICSGIRTFTFAIQPLGC